MLKKFLIVGVILGSTGFAVSGAALLGVMLGTRAVVVSADAMRATVPLSIAAHDPAVSPEVRLAMRGAVAAGE